MIKHLFFLLIIGLYLGCSGEVSTQQAATKIKTLDTPEKVVREWQRCIDKNEFDAARKLSTQNTEVFIDFLEQLGSIIPPDEGIIDTEFQSMNCEIIGDSAVCHTVIVEEGELIEDDYLLQKLEGQWLVHILDENLDDYNGELLYDDLNFPEAENPLQITQ